MAFQAVPDTAEIIIRYVQNFEEMVSTLHARQAGGYTLGELTTLATAVDAEIPVTWLPAQTVDAVYQSTTVRGLAFENDQEVTVNTSSAAGDRAAAGLPGNVTFSIKKGSGLTGRSARGRLYWIGLSRDQLSANENVLGAVAVTDVVNALDQMRLAIITAGWQPAIVSRFSGGVKRVVGVTFDWSTVSAVDDNMDSQRRRLAS